MLVDLRSSWMLNCGPPSSWVVHYELDIVWPLSHKIGCAQQQCVINWKEGIHVWLKQDLKKQISLLGGFLSPLSFMDMSGRSWGAAVVHFWVVSVSCELGSIFSFLLTYSRNLPNKALGIGWEREGTQQEWNMGNGPNAHRPHSCEWQWWTDVLPEHREAQSLEQKITRGLIVNQIRGCGQWFGWMLSPQPKD